MPDNYELATVLNTPLLLTHNIENNVIKICYKLKSTGEEANNKGLYKIEYYYNGANRRCI